MIGESNPLNFLVPGTDKGRGDPGWATVTSLAPLRVRKDNEASPLAATPQSLVSGLQLGDRVILAEWRDGDEGSLQPIILGKGGGIAPSPVIYSGSAIMASLSSGVSISAGSEVQLDGRRVVGNLSFNGVSRSSGDQSTAIGTLRADLRPVQAVGMGAYYSNGAATIAITGGGVMTVRWADRAASNLIYAGVSWLVS